jgi:hypothetical protein
MRAHPAVSLIQISVPVLARGVARLGVLLFGIGSPIVELVYTAARTVTGERTAQPTFPDDGALLQPRRAGVDSPFRDAHYHDRNCQIWFYSTRDSASTDRDEAGCIEFRLFATKPGGNKT